MRQAAPSDGRSPRITARSAEDVSVAGSRRRTLIARQRSRAGLSPAGRAKREGEALDGPDRRSYAVPPGDENALRSRAEVEIDVHLDRGQLGWQLRRTGSDVPRVRIAPEERFAAGETSKFVSQLVMIVDVGVALSGQ